MATRRQTSIERTCDSLRIIISRSPADDQQFQVRLEQDGAPTICGSLRQHDVAGAFQELRLSYQQQLGAIYELAATGMPAPPPDERHVLDLGRRVAGMLPQAARHAIRAAVQRARGRRRSLRLTLEVANDARELLSIPWELMALPVSWGACEGAGEDGFLFLNGDITLIRQARGIGLNRPLMLDHPLRIQAFAATPLCAPPIDSDTTLEAIRQAQPSQATQYHWYDGRDTLGALQERLCASSPQVVHLLCHGEQTDTGRGTPRYDLLFTRADGYTQRVGSADLARVLTLAPDLQLVVLQACYAGATAVNTTNDGARRQVAENIALALIRAGVPAVVAMQGEVGQAAAAVFVRACYATLARSGNLDQAVAAGRIAMCAAGDIVDWSLPVVYQGSRQIPAPRYTRLAGWFESLFLQGSRQIPAPRYTRLAGWFESLFLASRPATRRR